MSTLFVFMVLVFVGAAAVTALATIRSRILAGGAFLVFQMFFAMHILPIRAFDFVSNTPVNKAISIALGALIGALIARRINPEYFRWKQKKIDAN